MSKLGKANNLGHDRIKCSLYCIEYAAMNQLQTTYNWITYVVSIIKTGIADFVAVHAFDLGPLWKLTQRNIFVFMNDSS